LSAADCGNDGDFRFGGQGAHEPTGITHVFVADEDVDVLANFALLVGHAVAHTGIERPQRRQRVGQRRRRGFDLHPGFAIRKFSQAGRNVEGGWPIRASIARVGLFVASSLYSQLKPALLFTTCL